MKIVVRRNPTGIVRVTVRFKPPYHADVEIETQPSEAMDHRFLYIHMLLAARPRAHVSIRSHSTSPVCAAYPLRHTPFFLPRSPSFRHHIHHLLSVTYQCWLA